MTVRTGFNYGPSPIPDDAIFANAMFPAVTDWHLTAGASYRLSESWELSGSFFWAPPVSQTDEGNASDMFSAMGAGTEIGMWQMGAQIAVTWSF